MRKISHLRLTEKAIKYRVFLIANIFLIGGKRMSGKQNREGKDKNSRKLENVRMMETSDNRFSEMISTDAFIQES